MTGMIGISRTATRPVRRAIVHRPPDTIGVRKDMPMYCKVLLMIDATFKVCVDCSLIVLCIDAGANNNCNETTACTCKYACLHTRHSFLLAPLY